MIREARAADGPALADLLFRSPQGGRMVVGQDRSQDPFARRRPYEQVTTLVVDGDEGIDATGTCATKTVTVDGSPVHAAYVFDVAVAGHARGRGLGRAVLDALDVWALERDAAFAYAHILRGNEASVRLFAASSYPVVADLASRVYPVFGERRGSAEARPLSDWDHAAELLRRSLGGYDLLRPLDGEGLRTLWTSLPGWRESDVWTTGRAVLGLWDYSAVVRPVPLRLPPEVRALGALERLARVARVPFPRPPAPGRPIGYGLLLGGGGEEADLRALFRGALGRARERALDVIVFFHDRRLRPGWAKAAFSVADTYHLVAKALRAEGPCPGSRPVWVDPADL